MTTTTLVLNHPSRLPTDSDAVADVRARLLDAVGQRLTRPCGTLAEARAAIQLSARGCERESSVALCLRDSEGQEAKGHAASAVMWAAQALGHLGAGMGWYEVERRASALALAGVQS